MKTDEVLLLYEYNYWANGRVLKTSSRAGPERFLAPAEQSYGSLRGTLVHIVDGERVWRTVFEGGDPPTDLVAEEFPTLEDVERRGREEETAMRRFLATLGDGDLDGIVRYTTDTGVRRERVLWHCLLHVVNHGTHHRAQAAAILRACGHSPGDLDFTVFLLEKR